jgi:hypothetical protein
MPLQSLRQAIRQAFSPLLTALEQSFKRCLQPTQSKLLVSTLADMTRSKSALIAENAFLRQQRIVLERQTKRPVLTPRDRGVLVCWRAVHVCGEKPCGLSSPTRC